MLFPEDERSVPTETLDQGVETAVNELDQVYLRLQESLRKDILMLETLPNES